MWLGRGGSWGPTATMVESACFGPVLSLPKSGQAWIINTAGSRSQAAITPHAHCLLNARSVMQCGASQRKERGRRESHQPSAAQTHRVLFPRESFSALLATPRELQQGSCECLRVLHLPGLCEFPSAKYEAA